MVKIGDHICYEQDFLQRRTLFKGIVCKTGNRYKQVTVFLTHQADSTQLYNSIYSYPQIVKVSDIKQTIGSYSLRELIELGNVEIGIPRIRAEIRRWAQGKWLHEYFKKCKKQKQLLAVRLPKPGSGGFEKVEFLLEGISFSNKVQPTLLVSELELGQTDVHTVRKVRDLSTFDIDRDVRILDREELLTGDNQVGRLFAVDPILQWLPKIEAKFKARIEETQVQSRALRKMVSDLFEQRNVFPSGTPKRVQTIGDKILSELLLESDLQDQLDLILKQNAEFHELVLTSLRERLTEIVEQNKDKQ